MLSLGYLSQIAGVLYTLFWSTSFIPQVVVNCRNRSTTGTTVDFPAVNFLGAFALFASNAGLFWSPSVRHQYALRHQGLTPTVQWNDLLFAASAIVLIGVNLTQFIPSLWGWSGVGRRPNEVRLSRTISGIMVGSVLAVLIVIIIVASSTENDAAVGWAWIDVIYTLGYVKLFIVLIKYSPQILLNYRNKSTKGFAILGFTLDLSGSLLSLVQLGIDAYLQGDWSGVTGNPVKLGLANISMFFDLVFMFQHYILYREHRGTKDTCSEEERNSLLANGHS